MKKTILIFISLTISAACNAQNENVVIVYSHNTNGVLENCKCPERSYGALEKRAAVIDSIRKVEKNVLLVDSGDILDIQANRNLHSHIVQAYDFIKYDYWTPGDQDFVEGTDFFRNHLLKMSASVVSSNIFFGKKPIGQLSVIKQLGKLRIGVTGTIEDDLHKYLESPADADFTFKDQYTALKPVIKDLEENTDFIILLSHSGIDRDRKLAVQFPSINLIIGGHSQTILSQPEEIGSTYIMQVGESGYRLGIFKIQFKQGKINKIQNSIILLTRNMPDHPAVVKMIEHYHLERLKR